MFLRNFHLSNAITYLFHSIISIVIGALVSFLIYVGQNAFTGTTDSKAVLLSGLGGAVVYFTTHFGALINSPQAKQAEVDLAKGVETRIVALEVSHQSLINFLTNPPAPVSQAVVQVPFPPANAAFGSMPVTPSQFAQEPQSSYPLAALGRELPQPPRG